MIFWDDQVMAKRYRRVDRDQAFLFPPDMREWLPADHPVHLVIRVVEEHLDTSAFHALRRTGGGGGGGVWPGQAGAGPGGGEGPPGPPPPRVRELCGAPGAVPAVCGGHPPRS